MYPLKTGDFTTSFKKQATASFGVHSPDRKTNHIKVLERGTSFGHALQKQSKVCDMHDRTLRNIFHPYHSNGHSMQKFNQQKLSKLKIESRFRSTFNSVVPDTLDDLSPFEGKEGQFYDIKGNTFKDTLIPKSTAVSALKPMTRDVSEHKLTKVVPLHKYTRSGTLMFNNIHQQHTAVIKTPRCNQLRDRNLTSLSVKSSLLGSEDDSPYMQWSKTRADKTPSKEPVLKHSSEIKKNLEQMVRYAPEFNAASMNNYDNTQKYVKRAVSNKYDVSHLSTVPR